MGSVSLVTSSTGSSAGTQEFDPWGKVRSGGSVGTQTTLNYTGQKLDGTGLLNYNARMYDPTVGRFVSPDSKGQARANPQTLNRYSYVLNNPINKVDPSGHWVDHPGEQPPRPSIVNLANETNNKAAHWEEHNFSDDSVRDAHSVNEGQPKTKWNDPNHPKFGKDIEHLQSYQEGVRGANNQLTELKEALSRDDLTAQERSMLRDAYNRLRLDLARAEYIFENVGRDPEDDGKLPTQQQVEAQADADGNLPAGVDAEPSADSTDPAGDEPTGLGAGADPVGIPGEGPAGPEPGAPGGRPMNTL